MSPTFAQAGDRIRTAATTRSTAMTIALSSELSPVSSPFRISRSVSNPDWIRTDLHYERPPGSEWIMRIRIRFLKRRQNILWFLNLLKFAITFIKDSVYGKSWWKFSFFRLGRQICKSVSDPDSGVFLIRIRSQHHYYPTRHRWLFFMRHLPRRHFPKRVINS